MAKTIDIIGDVHGHAQALVKLLLKLGYRRDNSGVYIHTEPGRKALFLGDLIDRGKENFKVLDIVKSMHMSKNAYVLMGNHEFNAICYHTPDKNGGFLRERSNKNRFQHIETLSEIKDDPGKWEVFLKWIKTLPLWLDFDGFCAAHACFDQTEIGFLREKWGLSEGNKPEDRFFKDAVRVNDPTFEAVETILKGPEIWLPEGVKIKDKDGHERKKVRVRWWDAHNAHKKWKTFADLAQADEETKSRLSLLKLDGRTLKAVNRAEKDKPVFFGHYWFSDNKKPERISERYSCLDYSIAKNGFLTAYTWREEKIIDNSSYTYVRN